MLTHKLCSYSTKRGLPCRNKAITGSDPLACWRHRPRQEDAVSGAGDPGDLTAELTSVREVIRRLLQSLDEAPQDLQPDELRKLAALIFGGARTVAYLLKQQNQGNRATQEWLDQALDVLSADHSLDL